MASLKCSLVATVVFLSGCQLDYLAHSAYNQAKLLNARRPIDLVLKDPAVPEETKRKLRLVGEAKKFGEEHLGLKRNRSYETFVQLDRDYVSYVLQVAPFNELKHYEWHFPIVGRMPYKGFFNPERAKAEALKFPADEWDTYIRGVSAYSTLGWFRDPVLSSMLRASDPDLVETILHETVHANLYIRNHADFNERLAVFLGLEGMKLFYRQLEGAQSATVLNIEREAEDDKLFSKFISRQLDELKAWYVAHPSFTPEEKTSRLKQIPDQFRAEVQPRLKSPDSYKNFLNLKFNNALLLNYQTYYYDLSDFERVYVKLGHDYRKFLEFCKSLEKADDPEKALKAAGSAS